MLLTRMPQRRRTTPAARSTAAPTGLTAAWTRFAAWRHRRPFVGGLLVALAGVEIFFSGQLDLGRLHVQLGIEGFQATVIPIALVLLGALAVAMPAHHVFYGVLALAVAVYSLIGVNLGGFLLGMILGCVGGVLVVAWMPRIAPDARDDADPERAGLADAGLADAGLADADAADAGLADAGLADAGLADADAADGAA